MTKRSREVLNEDLGCASYVIADGGEAAVVDPKWEIEEYLKTPRRTASGSRTYSRPTTTLTTSRATDACEK